MFHAAGKVHTGSCWITRREDLPQVRAHLPERCVHDSLSMQSALPTDRPLACGMAIMCCCAFVPAGGAACAAHDCPPASFLTGQHTHRRGLSATLQ